MTTPKRLDSKDIERINALFEEFVTEEEMEEESNSDQQLNEQYEHYATRRTEFVMQSRKEIVEKMHPSRDPNTLTKKDWESMNPAINARFRELLISAFPENHFQLNELYLLRKQNSENPHSDSNCNLVVEWFLVKN